jgi:hypothetical protein
MVMKQALNQKETDKLEETQMQFLRPLLDLIRLDNQRNSDIRKRLKVTNIVKRDVRIPKNVVKSFGKDGNRPPSISSIPIFTDRKKTRNDQNDNGETKTIFRFIEEALNDS